MFSKPGFEGYISRILIIIKLSAYYLLYWNPKAHDHAQRHYSAVTNLDQAMSLRTSLMLF